MNPSPSGFRVRPPEPAPPPWERRALPEWLVLLARAEGALDPMAYLARHSRSFRFAARFLPAREAAEVAEVYAYCRFSDDIVDADRGLPPEELEARLDAWLDLSRQAHAGQATGLPLLDRPMMAASRRGISFRYMQALLEGMRMDLRQSSYRSLDELEVYTHRVAGVVGQWLSELWGIRSPWVLARAGDLGHAMQITNILRDVGEDWRRGRLYLPLDLLGKHGLEPEEIGRGFHWNGNVPGGYRDLMEEMMEVAEEAYRRAFNGIPFLPVGFQRTVLISALVYREILSALRANGYDNFNRRAASSRSRKVALGLQAYWIAPCLRTLFPAKPEPAYG